MERCGLIGGVAHAFDLNMVPEAVSKKFEPMLEACSRSLPWCIMLAEIQYKETLSRPACTFIATYETTCKHHDTAFSTNLAIQIHLALFHLPSSMADLRYIALVASHAKPLSQSIAFNLQQRAIALLM